MGFKEQLQRFGMFPDLPVPTNGNGTKVVAPPQSKAVLINSPLQFWLDGQSSYLDAGSETVAAGRTAYAAAALAYICIRYRATKVIEAPLMVVEETDDGEEWIEDHELSPLLAKPSPDMAMRRLLEATQVYLDTTGRALWVKNRDRGARVGSLYAFSGDSFEVEETKERLFGKYTVQTNRGRQVFGAEDVIYFAYFHATDPFGGLAPLEAALSHLNIGQILKSRVRNLVKNAAFPGGILSLHEDTKLSPEDYERLKNELNFMMQGMNTGKVALLEGGAEFTRVAMTPADLTMGDLWREVEATVCGCFQVPPSLVGTMVGAENSPWSHLETAKRSFYDETIIPQWAFLEEPLTEQLLREVDDDPSHMIRFDTSRIRALQEDKHKQAETSEKNRDIWTVDERRIYTGQEPLDDERGQIIVGLQPPPPMRVQLGDDDRAAAAKASQRPTSTKVLRRTPDEAWKSFDVLTKAQETGWLLAVSRQLRRDRTKTLALFRDNVFSGQKDEKPKPDPGQLDEFRRKIDDHFDRVARSEWLKRVRPLLNATGRTALQSVVSELGVSFDLLQPGLTGYVQKEAAWLVTHINETTRQAVRDAIEAGVKDGDGIPQLAKRLEEAGAFARSRATLIARTETTRATNGAQRASLAQYQLDTGDVVQKTWLSSRDSRVREEHQVLDGETVNVDQLFSNGLNEPSEPNCRCTLTYALELEEEPKRHRGPRHRAASPESIALKEVVTAFKAATEQLPPPINVHVNVEAVKPGRRHVSLEKTPDGTSTLGAWIEDTEA